MMAGYYEETIWWEDYIIRRYNDKKLYYEAITWLGNYMIKKLYDKKTT